MKKLLFLVWAIFSINLDAKNALTYKNDNAGRLGDQIMIYTKANYLSKKKDLPLYCKKFPYYDSFALSDYETELTPEIEKEFNEKKDLLTPEDIEKDKDGILYVIDYCFRETKWSKGLEKEKQVYKHFDRMFADFEKDSHFAVELKKMLQPKQKPTPLHIPKKSIKVAIHVRTGRGFDSDEQKKRFPLRFLPPDYYSEQLKRILPLFNKKPVHIQLFTEAKNPKPLADILKESVKPRKITISYRKKGNQHDKNVVQDLYHMSKFDVLIRPWSQYSRIAQFLGTPKLVVFPTDRYEKDNQTIIETDFVSKDQNLFNNSLKKKIIIN